MYMPRVSVIIPVYNVEMYLHQCLDSIVNQTFRDMEIICMDDGSTDKSGAILDEYALFDNRIKVVHKENTGYGHNMNEGLRLCTGEYTAIVESDDFAESDMIEKMYEAMKISGADIIKAKHYNYRMGEDSLCNLIDEFPMNKVMNSTKYPRMLKLAHTIWSCMYRTEFLRKNEIRFHETPGASYQDISFAMQGWLKAQKVYFIEDAFLHYRNDNPNSSMHNPNKIFCVFDEYKWLEEKFRYLWKKQPMLEKYFVAQKYMDYFSHYYRVAMQYQYAFLLRFSAELNRDFNDGRIFKECFDTFYWDALHEIDADINKFFLRTAKKIQDLRLELCYFWNEESYKKGFLDVISTYPEVVIYGVGNVGKKLADALLKNSIAIKCFAVTKMEDNLSEYHGIPVRELESIKDIADTCAVIVAVVERNQFMMYQNLMKYEFKHVFRVDEIVRGIE